jgi:superfamily II DNA/RNA helicase
MSEGPLMKFSDLNLAPAVLEAVEASGYTTPTEVQLRAIPAAMAGHDLLVSSSTGSGKTAAFVIPSLQRILAIRATQEAAHAAARAAAGQEGAAPVEQAEPAGARRRGGRPGPGGRRFGERDNVQGNGARGTGPRVLVLAPTRELALQVSKASVTYGRGIRGLRVASVVGGVPYGLQINALRNSPDMLIATPGRLLDLLSSGQAVLSDVEMLILDEADRMLDMGFIDDISAIAEQVPEGRQTLMFSATFGGQVGGLAQRLTRQAQRIDVASHTDRHANIEQRLHWADSIGHKNALLDHLLTGEELDQAVVFTSTQRDADELADRLADAGHAVAALHGGLPQGRRNRVLQALRQGELRVLVATDVAARGIDVPTISHVINYGLPLKAEDYVHRIGRTGRAGRSGLAVTLAERRDTPMIRRIERYTTQPIPTTVVAGLEPKMPSMEKRREGRPGGFSGGPGGNGGGYRPGGNSRPSGFGDRPAFGDRGDRPAFGDRGDRPAFGDRPSFGDRPAFGDRQGRRPPSGRPGAPRRGDR